MPIYNTNEIMAHGIKAIWASKTPTEAYEILRKPDVMVTMQAIRVSSFRRFSSSTAVSEIQSFCPHPQVVAQSGSPPLKPLYAPSLRLRTLRVEW